MFQLEQEPAVILSCLPPHHYTKRQQQKVRGSLEEYSKEKPVEFLVSLKNKLELSHTQIKSTHTKVQFMLLQVMYCQLKELVHFLFVAKSLSQTRERSEMNICFFMLWTEARGMERYLGGGENTDALTFKKAASHSRQNNATPLPLCTVCIPWCLQPPSILVHGSLQTNTHKKKRVQRISCICEYVPVCAIVL